MNHNNTIIQKQYLPFKYIEYSVSTKYSQGRVTGFKSTVYFRYLSWLWSGLGAITRPWASVILIWTRSWAVCTVHYIHTFHRRHRTPAGLWSRRLYLCSSCTHSTALVAVIHTHVHTACSRQEWRRRRGRRRRGGGEEEEEGMEEERRGGVEEEEEMTGEEAGGALVSVMSGEYCQINILNIINICIYISKHNNVLILY